MNLNDLRIEAAIASYPEFPAPQGFSRRVMEKIRLEKERRRTIRFHLDFIDLVLPLFFAFFTSLGFGILLWLITLIDPNWLVLLRLELQNIVRVLPDFTGWLAVIFAGLGLGVFALGLLVAFFFLRPRSIYQA